MQYLEALLTLKFSRCGKLPAGLIRNRQERRRSIYSPMEILHQLGELFLRAVPTVVIFLLFYVFLRWAFFTPLQKAMAERKAFIEGAKAEAAAVERAAQQEMDTYKAALRKARAGVYAEQEAARQAALDERALLLKAMRARSQEEVTVAKKKLADEMASAQTEIERQTPVLASDIARTILRRRPPSRQGMRP
ncbi:MAG: hypothetical protein ACRD4C_06665 [Candidatus Acidiferrales bacterium]